MKISECNFVTYIRKDFLDNKTETLVKIVHKFEKPDVCIIKDMILKV